MSDPRGALRGSITTAGSVLAVLVLLAAPAAAHAVLLESAPADGERVDGGPEEITLTFNEPMSPPATLTVTGPGDDTVHDEDPDVEGETVSTAIEPLTEDGTYTVAWRAVSDDGHPVEGEFTFDVAAAQAPEEEAGEEVEEADGEPAVEEPTEPEEVPEEPEPTDDEGTAALVTDEGDGMGTVTLLLAVVGGLVVVAAVATVLARRRDER